MRHSMNDGSYSHAMTGQATVALASTVAWIGWGEVGWLGKFTCARDDSSIADC